MIKDCLAVVVAEIGAAVFLEPIFSEWLTGCGPGIPWHVVAGPPAARRLAATFDKRLPISVVENTNVDVSPLISQASALLVSAGCNRLMESHALRHAKTLNIPTLQFIETWYNYRRRFQVGGELLMGDCVMLIDEVAFAEAVDEGLPIEKLTIAGQPAWERACSNLPEAPEGHVLVLGSPIRELLNGQLPYDQVTCWDLIVSASERRPDLFKHLAYAPHPEERWFPSGVQIIHDSVTALLDYSIVLGSFAAPMIDAYLGGRVVASVQPQATHTDFCPLSRQRLVPKVGNVDDLIHAISMNPVSSDALRMTLAGSLSRVQACIHKNLVES